MRSGVVLHIGFCKTGTTSIQHWMRDHEELLARHGVRFPRGWLRLNNHFELPVTLTRLDRIFNARLQGAEWRDVEWRLDVLEQIMDDLDRHHDELTVFSAEYLSLFRYDDELAPLRTLLGDAEVIAYHRRPVDFLASMSAHYCKEGMPGLSNDVEAYNYLEPDSWRADYDTLLHGWRRHFARVTVIDYDAIVERDGSVIPSFARRLGLAYAPDVDRYHLNRRTDPIPRVEGNRSLGLRFGEALEVATDSRLSQ